MDSIWFLPKPKEEMEMVEQRIEIEANQIGAIPRADIKASVEQALEITFAKEFSPFAKGPEGMAGKFIQAFNGIPGAAFVVPFPRFMMNSVKWTFEFSPLGFLRLISPEVRNRIAAGDMSTISRATIGVGLFLTRLSYRRQHSDDE